MAFFRRAAVLSAFSAFAGASYKAQQDPLAAQVQCAPFQGSTNKNSAFTTTFQQYKLGEILNLAEDVAIFRFLLHNADDQFDLVPCSTLQAQFATGANRIEQVQRAYTPITPNGAKGYFDILVKKMYQGRMTETLFSLKPGDQLQFRVVFHKLKYTPNKWEHVGLIGGGTGLTPLLQVIRHALMESEDKTKLTLLFANQTPSKILLKGLLDDLVIKSHGRFETHYVVDRIPEGESLDRGFIGHINAAMIRETMPPPSDKNLVLVCGPDPMVTALTGVPRAVLKQMSGGLPQQPLGGSINNYGELGGVLAELGYKNEQVYRF